MPDTPWRRSLDDIGVPLRVAWAPTLGYGRVDREVRAICQRAVDLLAGMGAEVTEIDAVFDEDPVMSWLHLTGAYLLRSLDHVRGTERWADIDPGLARLVEWASTWSPVEVIRAIDAEFALHHRLVELFHRHSILLTPTVVGQTPAVGHQGTIDGEETVNWVANTYPFNMTRSPAGTVCAGLTADGMPVGLQVVGPQHADVAVLRAVAVLEDALGLFTPPN
jgi:aspartyl-tRNA(Asn)/glutamyl-tRNA(Gln) amidotransferase subunit A